MRTTLLRLVPVVLALSVASSAYALSPVACTSDAKLCPDGVTYVGRDGSNNCEWQKCPSAQNNIVCGTPPVDDCSDGWYLSASCDTTTAQWISMCLLKDGIVDPCLPYLCRDGSTVPRCGDDGNVINYFAEPCHMNGGEESSSFSDIPADHPNADAITYVKEQGIVEGYVDGTFKPDATINRAEFVKILMGSFEDDGRMCKIAAFSDVDQTAWYATYAHKARCQGIVEGYPDGRFKPAASINFVEAAKILANAFDIAAPGMAQGDAWYKPYVMSLERANAIPTSITSFDQSITRGEMAEMIYRLKAGIVDRKSLGYEQMAKLTSMPNILNVRTVRVGDTFGALTVSKVDIDEYFQGVVTFSGPVTIPVTFRDHSQDEMGPGGVCFAWDSTNSDDPYAFPVTVYEGEVYPLNFCVERTTDIASKFPIGSKGTADITMKTFYYLALPVGLDRNQKVQVANVEIESE